MSLFHKDSSAFYSAAASAAGASSAGASVASSAGASAAALAASSAAFFSASALAFTSFIFFSASRRALASAFLSFFFLSFQSSQTALFVVLPSFELSFCFCFAECAFCYTAKKVFLHVNAFAREDVANSVGRLCTFQYPVKCAVELQIYCGRIGVRVVSTNLLNKFTITWCSYVCNYDRVESIAFTSMSLQSDFCCHLNKCF